MHAVVLLHYKALQEKEDNCTNNSNGALRQRICERRGIPGGHSGKRIDNGAHTKQDQTREGALFGQSSGAQFAHKIIVQFVLRGSKIGHRPFDLGSFLCHLVKLGLHAPLGRNEALGVVLDGGLGVLCLGGGLRLCQLLL